MQPDQEPSNAKPDVAETEQLSPEELAIIQQQEQWHKAYIEQQLRMCCPRGGCGEGDEVF